MTDITYKIATLIEEIPISVGLFSKTGRILARVGGRMAGLHRDIAPSQDPHEAARWRFLDERGAAIAPTHWASACALRGECNDAGLVGSYWDHERHPVRVTCVPTLAPDSDVAIVAFLQFLDAPTRCAEGSHQDLQQRLIRELASAVASRWQEQRTMN